MQYWQRLCFIEGKFARGIFNWQMILYMHCSCFLLSQHDFCLFSISASPFQFMGYFWQFEYLFCPEILMLILFVVFVLPQQVPEALYGGTGNYASALFLTAAKANLLDKVETEIRDVVEASKKSPLFSQFIKDLSVPKETRVKAITEIFAEAGFSDVTKNFLGILLVHTCYV